MKWEQVTFSKLYAEPSKNGVYKSKEHQGRGIKIVNMGELFAHGIISDQEMKRIEMTDSEMQRFNLINGDLLFARRSLVESGAGKCSLVDNLKQPTTFESSIIRVRLDQTKVIPKFYYYWFRSLKGRGVIYSLVTGTNVKGIRGNDLKNITVDLPPIDTQNKITDILSKYDDLIENNRRRIELLEESARLLYREWFVHLRFPGHEHSPIIDGIPEGWERKPLKEVGYLNYGKTLTKRDRVPGDYSIFGSGGIIGTHKNYLVEGPGIIIGRKGSVGSVFWSEENYYPIDTTYYIDREQSNLYLYHALKNIGFMNTDVAVPGLNRSFAHSRTLIIPNQKYLDLFENLAKPIYQQISKLNQYNKKLSQARDLLLPRLMNGEITV